MSSRVYAMKEYTRIMEGGKPLKPDDISKYDKYYSMQQKVDLLNKYNGINEKQLPEDIFIDSFKIPGVIFSQNRFLSKTDLNIPEKYVCLSGDMGTNKTGAVIDSLNENESILWIVPRISLTTNTLKRITLDKLKFESYLNWSSPLKKDKIKTFDKLICCVPSLKYTVNKTYDTIIIDEIETILMMLKGDPGTPGASDINQNWTRLKDIIYNAKKVYVMDAFLCNRTINLLLNIHNAPIKIITSPGVPLKREFIKHEHIISWQRELICKLKEGKNVFVFYPYVNEGNNNKSMEDFVSDIIKLTDLTSDEIIYYNADRMKITKETLNDVNTIWSSKRCIITNTCITVGVNFDLNHFDYIFANWARWVSHRDFFQVLYRCRKLKTQEIHLISEGRAFKNYNKNNINVNCPIYHKLLNEIKLEEKVKGNDKVFKFYSNKCNINLR